MMSLRIAFLLFGLCSDVCASGLGDGAVEQDSGRQILEVIDKEMGTTRRQAVEKHVEALEMALRSMYIALPKNEHGNLGRSAVSYALHRVFVERRGWFVKGLIPGNTSATSSPVEILQDTPQPVKALFEARLAARGLKLREVAILGSAVEDLVHREALTQVATSFKALRIPLMKRVSPAQLDLVLDRVMKTYILEAADFHGKDAEQYLSGQLSMEDVYPGWPETQEFLRGVRGFVAPNKSGSLSFSDVAQIVEEVWEHYGQRVDRECGQQKTKLLKLEGQCPGRVDMRQFYAESVYKGVWQFSESLSYLRSLGALDESLPGRPSLLVSNYVLGASNCVGNSRYYAQCCIDPCDGLMAKLEKALAAPDALPDVVAAAVAVALPDGRTILSSLRRRLDEIAAANGGTVPLHGRLFAQWLHHAYPHECPAPPAVGAILHSELPDQFTARTGQDAIATEEDMRKQALSWATEKVTRKECRLPWTSGEELLDSPAVALASKEPDNFPWTLVAAAIVAVTAAAAGIFGAIHRRTKVVREARAALLITEQPKEVAAADAGSS